MIMTGYRDRARRGAVGSGVADRSRTCVSLRQTPRLTWAFAWQVLDSNQGRLTSTVLQGAGRRSRRSFLPAGTPSEMRTACGSTTPQPRAAIDGRLRPDVTGPTELGQTPRRVRHRPRRPPVPRRRWRPALRHRLHTYLGKGPPGRANESRGRLPTGRTPLRPAPRPPIHLAQRRRRPRPGRRMGR